jgi:hypothetical protein
VPRTREVGVEQRQVFLDRRDEGHVHEGEAAALLALEHGEALHEQRCPGAGVDAAELAAEVGAQPPEDAVRLRELIRREEQHGARPRLRAFGDAGALALREELRDRRLPGAVGAYANPGEALAAELLLHEGLEPVDLAARQRFGVVDGQALDHPALLDRGAEGAEGGAAEQVGELHPRAAPASGLSSRSAHRLGVGHARERARQ